MATRSAAAKPRTPRASDAALERDARDLYAALTDLVRLYQFRDRNLICCHDISVTQCWAIDALVRGGAMTLGSLAGELMLDKSTASRVVEALERKGYVKRVPHPDDARALRISATPSGRALRESIARDLVEEEARIIEHLAPEVRRAAIGVVRDLAASAARRFGRDTCCGGEKEC